jgi:hypothetical protein
MPGLYHDWHRDWAATAAEPTVKALVTSAYLGAINVVYFD